MNGEKNSIIMFFKGIHFKVDLALHFTILVIIYTLMFDFVISKLIQKELFKVLDNYSNNTNSINLDNQQKNFLNKLMNEYKTQNKNDSTYQHNKKLRIILYSCVALIIIFFMLLIHYYIFKKKISMKQFKIIIL